MIMIMITVYKAELCFSDKQQSSVDCNSKYFPLTLSSLCSESASGRGGMFQLVSLHYYYSVSFNTSPQPKQSLSHAEERKSEFKSKCILQTRVKSE